MNPHHVSLVSQTREATKAKMKDMTKTKKNHYDNLLVSTCKTRYEKTRTYPFRGLWVFSHEPQVNIWLFVLRVQSPSVDVLSVEESDVNDSGHERRETQCVSHGEYWADQERRIRLVRFDIQCQVFIQNSRRVVHFAEVIEVLVGAQRQVLVEFCPPESNGISTYKNDETTNKGVPDGEGRIL